MKRTRQAALLLLLAPLLYSAPAHADSASDNQETAIYLDGRPLQFGVQPLFVNDTVLVPMRKLFEEQGAKLSWDNQAKSVTATKGETVLSYRIGDGAAYTNGKLVTLSVPGQIVAGNTMMPLRYFSEALGNQVKWDPVSHEIRINSAQEYNTKIVSAVNLRTVPDSGTDSSVIESLPAGEKVQVLEETDALWLKVRTEDNKTGYISAKPGFSDYTSPSLAELQGNALLAYGEKFLGTPYEFGASPDQTRTFDCSSFVGRVFKEVLSIDLARVSYNQAKEGKEVSIGDLRKGDLLFFSARGLNIGHVAIYAGNNRILHTYSKEQGVHYETLDSKWMKRFVTARRVF
ncbi:stalk domain-containing protein [Paenibacillus sp. NPDC056722]|uniref:C40 family peptidase n=1 Tax=Paenibacillus sp. NPDC056722 TaxID=3345924 RepID=UPI00369335D3